MLSAKEMCDLATKSTNSKDLLSIEEKMKEAAMNGKFFIRLCDTPNGCDSAQLAIMNKYGSDVYRTLERLGYISVIYRDSFDSGVYVGFAHTSDKVLLMDIAKSKC